MEQSTINHTTIVERDFILNPLYLRFGLTSMRIIVFIAVISGILFFGAGSIASLSYEGLGKHITSFDNILFLVAWLVIFVPLIWSAYLWQAKTVPELIFGLIQNDSFGKSTSESRKTAVRLSQTTLKFMTNFWVYFLAAGTLILFWIVELTVSWPEQFQISQEYWFEVKWYLPIHILTWSITLYPLFIFVIRHILFIARLRITFEKCTLEVKPLAPDECGGLGKIGDFIKASILVSIGLGLIAVLFSFVIYLNGSDILKRPDVVSLFILYIVLVPLSLLIPLLSARSAMLQSRERFLTPIAIEFQEVLDTTQKKIPKQTNALQGINERLNEIQRYREIVMKTYPTLPISLGALQKFSVSASIPLLSGAASLAFQILAPHP